MEFSPNAYDLDCEYRNRTERHAAKQRLAQSVQQPGILRVMVNNFFMRIKARIVQWWNRRSKYVDQPPQHKFNKQQKRVKAH